MKNTEASSNRRSRTITLYRLFVFVLLGVIAVQAWVMQKAADEASAQDGEDKGEVAVPEDGPEESIQSSNLKRNFNEISVRFSDIAEYREWLFLRAQGAVRARVLGFGQDEPFRFHRRSDTAIYVVAGEGVIEHVCGTDEPIQIPLSPGSVATIEPYCAYRLRNTTTESMLAQLEFLIPAPLNAGNSDAIIVSADDPRGRLGPAPAVHDWSTHTGPDTLTSFGATLIREVVTGDTTFPAVSGETGLYVVDGTGILDMAVSTELSPGSWAVVPPGTAFTVRSAGSPLHVIRFSPSDDGVPELVRSGRSVYSQMAEERIARAFFDDREGGVYLDVGAGHYERLSTTYFLDSHLGWSGIAVDAQAEYAADYEEHRPKAQYFTFLISDEDSGEGILFRDRRVGGAASVNEVVTREQTELSVGEANIEEISVPFITLNTLLTHAEVESIDFLSMDIEEHEPAALRGFDIERYRPALVCVESHGRTQDVLFEYFVSHGYERLDEYLAYDPVNWYFAPIDR